jgi:hypothetical protein
MLTVPKINGVWRDLLTGREVRPGSLELALGI